MLVTVVSCYVRQAEAVIDRKGSIWVRHMDPYQQARETKRNHRKIVCLHGKYESELSSQLQGMQVGTIQPYQFRKTARTITVRAWVSCPSILI